jgi:hypothetical protein
MSTPEMSAWFWGVVGVVFLLNRIWRLIRRLSRKGHRPKAAPSPDSE